MSNIGGAAVDATNMNVDGVDGSDEFAVDATNMQVDAVDGSDEFDENHLFGALGVGSDEDSDADTSDVDECADDQQDYADIDASPASSSSEVSSCRALCCYLLSFRAGPPCSLLSKNPCFLSQLTRV